MTFQYEEGRIFAQDENGKTIAEILFPAVSETEADIRRTFVDESLQGQGIAGQLMTAAIAEIERQQRKAIPTCSYAKGWFGKHPEYSHLLAGESGG